MLTSKICNKSDFDSQWFLRWRPYMRLYNRHGFPFGGKFLHRKEWEFVVVSQALEERGLLQQASRGIGFGVGQELLPALFASRNCHVVATDYLDDSGGDWRLQWPTHKEVLFYPEICPRTLFDSNIDFQRIDMNNVPANLREYDFSWSCSSLEHLGTLERGLTFLLNQMHCLKPGGWAVHTTGLNLLSNDDTQSEGATVLYRRQDIERLSLELTRQGHLLEEVDYSTGTQMEDWFVAHPPYADFNTNLAHLRVLMGKHVFTSMVLIIRKAM